MVTLYEPRWSARPELNLVSVACSDLKYCYSPRDGMLVHRRVTPSSMSQVPISTDKALLGLCMKAYVLLCVNVSLVCSWWFGIRCFFGGAGCSATPGIRGTVFILMYVLSYIGGANLMRHAEGATWLAIVTVTATIFIYS